MGAEKQISIVKKGALAMNQKFLFQSIMNAGFVDEIYLLDCGRESCVPGKVVQGIRQQESFSLHIVTSGKGTLCYGNDSVNLHAGDFFVIMRGMPFRYFPDDSAPWNYIWIDVSGQLTTMALQQMSVSVLHPFLHLDRNCLAREFMSRIVLDFEENGTFSLQSLGNYLLLIHQLCCSCGDDGESLTREEIIVREAVKFILNNGFEIKVSDVASNLGIHPNYFASVFQKNMGMTPKQYLTRRRMREARRLLLSVKSVKEVAFSVGYSDALHFSKEFKKLYGCSPSRIARERKGC